MSIAQRLALARLVSVSGGSAAFIGLVAAIYGRTGSALWVSAAIFSSVVASVVSAPAAGWIGDHFDRRNVLIGSDALAMGVSLAMAAAAAHPLALVVLLGTASVAGAPFEPASAAAVPSLVEPAAVARTNSLLAASSSAGYLAGPLLGGALLGLGASPAQLFLADAATFAFSALLVITIRRGFGSGSTQEHPGMLAGARLVASTRALRIPVLAGMVSLLGIGIVDVASYPLSLHLHGGTTGYGAMTALLGGGGVVGAGLAARLLRRDAAVVLAVGFTAGAVGLGVAAGAPLIWIVLVGMAVAGAGRGLGDVAQVTLIQERARDEVRGRVFATQEAASHIAFSVSAFSGGLLVEAGGARAAFAVAAAFGCSAALVAAAAIRRSV